MIKAPTIRRLAANDSYTFLMQELERIDNQILDPLSGTDWPRDMPVIAGGGLIESISSIDVTYASTGKDDDNLFFDAANEIPVIQADLSKQVARTFNWAEYMSFTVTEKEKMMSVGRDPETFLNKGIRLHCDKTIDRNVYRGFSKVNSTGLCNSPLITRTSAWPGAGGTSTWQSKTPDEILNDINRALSAVWKDNDCSERSILTYVLENNIATKQGKELVISPCKWCAGIGSGSTDRMVVYMNQVDRVCFNLTQPLRRMETEYAEMRIKIPYIAQFSEVRFLYPSTVRYVDGI